MGDAVQDIFSPVRKLLIPEKDTPGIPEVLRPENRTVEQKQDTKVLQSAKSRQERLAAARGRSSFRIRLTDSDDKLTRSGISLG